MINFLFKSWKGVLVHLLLAISLSYFIVYYFFEIHLPEITEHGMVITVPNLEHLPLSEAERTLKEKELRLEVKDTVYSEKHDPGTIITQNPKPNFEVKRNRRIYVTLNSGNVPKVTITEEILARIVKSDINDVREQVKSLGFKPEIINIDAPFENYVYEAKYRGNNIENGQKIAKGSTITLMVGNGNGAGSNPVEEEEDETVTD